MAGGRRARQETRREIEQFLSIGPVQVAELDLPGARDAEDRGTADTEGVELRPGPGGAPITSGSVFVLVRRAGRPVGTLLGQVPDGADPVAVLAGLARELPPQEPPEP
ncbi:glycosyltransferase family 2 protein, partial [Streptomyces rochei]|nr:glycosyltransferase family 2 protein [Streptomyces rochei]